MFGLKFCHLFLYLVIFKTWAGGVDRPWVPMARRLIKTLSTYKHAIIGSQGQEEISLDVENSLNAYSPWAKTPKIGFFVPIGGTSAIMEFCNLHLSKFKKIHDIKAESVAILVK